MKPFVVMNTKTGKRETITLKDGIENAVLQIFKNQSPVNRGILKGQIRIEKFGLGFRVVSDIYYMPYTEEKWIYNRRWGKTLPNPNEGWFKTAMEISIKFVSSVYGKEFRRVS